MILLLTEENLAQWNTFLTRITSYLLRRLRADEKMNEIAAVIEALVLPVCGAVPFANEERARVAAPAADSAHGEQVFPLVWSGRSCTGEAFCYSASKLFFIQAKKPLYISFSFNLLFTRGVFLSTLVTLSLLNHFFTISFYFNHHLIKKTYNYWYM